MYFTLFANLILLLFRRIFIFKPRCLTKIFEDDFLSEDRVLPNFSIKGQLDLVIIFHQFDLNFPQKIFVLDHPELIIYFKNRNQ